MFTRARPGQLVRGSMREETGNEGREPAACSHKDTAVALQQLAWLVSVIQNQERRHQDCQQSVITAAAITLYKYEINEMKLGPSQSGQQRFVCYCFLKELNITEQAWILHGSANYT